MTGQPAAQAVKSWPLQSSLVLGALPSAAGCARLHAGSVMCEWGLAVVAEKVELVVSELVTNGRRRMGPQGPPARPGDQAIRAGESPAGHPAVAEMQDSMRPGQVSGRLAAMQAAGRLAVTPVSTDAAVALSGSVIGVAVLAVAARSVALADPGWTRRPGSAHRRW